MEKTVVIMRGIAGSGKSTLAKQMLGKMKYDGYDNSVIYSTDDYFTMEDGRYVFDGRRLFSAHEWNFARFQRAVDLSYDFIIADNVHTQFWECLKYAEYALKHFYVVTFAEPDTSWKFNAEELFKRNKHGVPILAIEKMIKMWESTEDILKGFEEKLGQYAVVNFETKTIRRTVQQW